MIFCRSLLFALWFAAVTIVMGTLALPLLLGPRQGALWLSSCWAKATLWGLKLFAGIDMRVAGTVPKQPVLIAAKHMSTWDTLAIHIVLGDPGIVLKRSLLLIPFFGWYVGKTAAIPIDRVKEVVNDIVKMGHTRYAGLGVSYAPSQALQYPRNRQYIAEQTGASNIPQQGIVIQEATGAAAAAGLKQFDIITEIDGTPIEGSFTLNKILTPKKPGDKVQLKYWSAGKVKTTTLTLQEINPAKNP